MSQRVKTENLIGERADKARPRVLSVWLLPGYYGWKGEGAVKNHTLALDRRVIRRLLPPTEKCPDMLLNQDHPLRYTTMVRALYWNTSTLCFEEGVFCIACASQGWVHREDNSRLLAKMHGAKYRDYLGVDIPEMVCEIILNNMVQSSRYSGLMAKGDMCMRGYSSDGLGRSQTS